MHNEQKLPIDDYVIDGDHHSDTDGVTKQREQVLNHSDRHSRLAGLVCVDKIETHNEEGSADGGVQDYEQGDQQSTQHQHDGSANCRYVVGFNVADIQLVLHHLSNVIFH